MKAQHQKFYPHDPENGVYGDCHRTALAMLLGMDRDELPNFADGVGSDKDGDTFHKRVAEWLDDHSLTQINIPFTSGSVNELLEWFAALNGNDCVFLLGGKSPRGEFDHTVVAGAGKILFDPHPSGDGLDGPSIEAGVFWITLITKCFPVRTRERGFQLALPLGI